MSQLPNNVNSKGPPPAVHPGMTGSSVAPPTNMGAPPNYYEAAGQGGIAPPPPYTPQQYPPQQYHPQQYPPQQYPQYPPQQHPQMIPPTSSAPYYPSPTQPPSNPYMPPVPNNGAYPIQQPHTVPYPQQPQGMAQGQYDPGARFDGIAQQAIPPPPPGCAPNMAQMAAANGQNVLMTTKKPSFF